MKKIGVMGGTYDPVHVAHLILAGAAMDKAGLDEIWFMPSKNPPHKQGKNISADKHRFRMLEIALEGYDRFIASDFELGREGITYSSDTFRLLKEEYPDHKFFLIIGGDSLMQLDTWHEPKELFKYASILATYRSGLDRDELTLKAKHFTEDMGADILLFDTPDMDISSSSIREMIKYGCVAEGLLPRGVSGYIAEQGLYQDYQLSSIKRILKEELKPKRYEHTLNVASTAYELAKTHGCDPHRAYLAGLLHDNGKAMQYDDQMAAAAEQGIELTDIEKRKPTALVHAKLGAHFAKTRFGIYDEEILDSIRYHTTGRSGMSLLEKIIFIADYIEPAREIPCEPNLASIRLIAFTDLDRAVYLELLNIVRYLENLGEPVDNITRETLKFYENIVNGNDHLP